MTAPNEYHDVKLANQAKEDYDTVSKQTILLDEQLWLLAMNLQACTRLGEETTLDLNSLSRVDISPLIKMAHIGINSTAAAETKKLNLVHMWKSIDKSFTELLKLNASCAKIRSFWI